MGRETGCIALELQEALPDDFMFLELSVESVVPLSQFQRRHHRNGGLALDLKRRKLAHVRQPFDLDFFNPRTRWPTPAPSDPLFDLASVAFGQCFHRAVGTIAHPTREPEILRFVNGRSPEVNALNPAADGHMGANTILTLRHGAIVIAPRGLLQLALRSAPNCG